jgi:L-cysteine:1D-myo-inositol 2-amino-2-deoxy-alpha-D-glucopyranoside ligase
MVRLDGEKMSKSLGNLVFVSRLLADGTPPMAIRLAILAHHYRGDWDWTDEGLAEAGRRLEQWRAAVAQAGPGAPAAEPVLAAVRERLADDLDAPGALAAVDAWAAAVTDAGSGASAGPADPGAGSGSGSAGDAGGPGELVRRTVDALLGVAL